MPTLTAKADQSNASVVLTVSDRAGVQGIMRTDANGTAPVRMPGGSGGVPGIGPGTIVDHEVALSGYVSYRLEHPDFADLVWVNMAPESFGWEPRFNLPAQPLITATAEVVTDYSAAQESVATFHDVIGRADPLVVVASTDGTGVLRSRRGELVAQFDSLDASAPLLALLRRGKTVLYRQTEHPGMDMYFHPEAVKTTVDAEMGLWSLHISYVEVARPTGTTASSDGWTFAALKVAHRNFAEVTGAYRNFADVALGAVKDD